MILPYADQLILGQAMWKRAVTEQEHIASLKERLPGKPPPIEVVFASTASSFKPIRVYYHDGTIKDFTTEEAVANGLGLSHTIARIVVTTTAGDTSCDLGFVNDTP